MVVLLYRHELTKIFPWGLSWKELNSQERRFIAARVMRMRGDPESLKTAFYLETGNPNFNQIAVSG